MRRILSLFVALLTVFTVISAAAAAESAPNQSIDKLISEIMERQKASSLSDITCGDIDDDLLAELGDSVMGLMHPNEAEHETMDVMMGGEGSDSLRAAHIYMAKSYLGCGLGRYGMMGGFMGNNMMNNGGYASGRSMMNGYGSSKSSLSGGGDAFFMAGLPIMGLGLSSGWMIFGLLVMFGFWAAVIIGIIWLFRTLFDRGIKNTKNGALSALKARYAKGEITKAEFDKIKKEVS